jgi:hypothetical protein
MSKVPTVTKSKEEHKKSRTSRDSYIQATKGTQKPVVTFPLVPGWPVGRVQEDMIAGLKVKTPVLGPTPMTSKNFGYFLVRNTV